MKTALVVGGTAASGLAIVEGLRTRGYEVTIYHRGTHEVDALLDLEHIHGDPHHRETIAADLGQREWDVTVATYGRTRYLADALRARTGHFVAISGLPVISAPLGVPTTEATPYERPENAPPGLAKILPLIIETEQHIIAAHRDGDFASTVIRYPYVYGPYAVAPLEWHVIQRAPDRRPRWTVQGGGLAIAARCAAPNAAELVLCALDRPEAAGGQIYNAADGRQFSQREWVSIIAAACDWEFEFVDVPASIAPLGSSSIPLSGEYSWVRRSDVENGILRHQLVDTARARAELGYRDAVDPAEWIERTVRHWLANPPLVDGEKGRLGPADFDYAAEDRLLGSWDRAVSGPPDPGAANVRAHPYDHPKSVKAS